MALLFDRPLPLTDHDKTRLVQENGLVLWDVLQQCAIKGSADASISQIELNPIDQLLGEYPVVALFANGKAAGKLYRRHLEQKIGRPITILPSTSPANARFSLADLARHWQVIRQV